MLLDIVDMMHNLAVLSDVLILMERFRCESKAVKGSVINFQYTYNIRIHIIIMNIPCASRQSVILI